MDNNELYIQIAATEVYLDNKETTNKQTNNLSHNNEGEQNARKNSKTSEEFQMLVASKQYRKFLFEYCKAETGFSAV